MTNRAGIRSVWLVRHGQRLDKVHPTWKQTAKRPHDTPLSEAGIVQAQRTAAFLQHADIAHIFSSPFHRALQTADWIAQKLQLAVHVEAGFSEWLNPTWSDQPPETIPKEEAKQLFTSIDHRYHSNVTPVYPEREQTDVLRRIRSALEGILAEYDGSILIVAHQCPIRQAAIALSGTEEGLLVQTCAVNQYVHDSSSGLWRLAFASTEHLNEAPKS